MQRNPPLGRETEENDNGYQASPDTIPDTHPNADAYPVTFDQITTAMVAVGALSAVVATKRGNPTAMALLASAIVSGAYCQFVERGLLGYHPAVLIALDVLVILWIVRGWANPTALNRYGRRSSLIVISLFLPVWPLYFDDRAWTSNVIALIVAAQMLLSFPTNAEWKCVASRWKGNFRNRRQWTELDMETAG